MKETVEVHESWMDAFHMLAMQTLRRGIADYFEYRHWRGLLRGTKIGDAIIAKVEYGPVGPFETPEYFLSRESEDGIFAAFLTDPNSDGLERSET